MKSLFRFSKHLRQNQCNKLYCTKSDIDFQPKLHVSDIKQDSSKDPVWQVIDEHVKSYKVLLYMKGTPSAPQCGFSQRVVQILHSQSVDFDSINVLEYNDIREGIKRYSEWPTIPQLYVNGSFIGGCDIITEMHQSGELQQVLEPYAAE